MAVIWEVIGVVSEKKNAVIKELELPVACLVHSGGKSLHAVVRVDAAEYMGVSEKTIRRKIKESKKYIVGDGFVKERDRDKIE